MPMSAVEWPERLRAFVQDLEVMPGQDGKGCCRIDVDVDADSLFLLNDLEARARHRKVQIPLGDGLGCLRGEMNTIIGLGSPAHPAGHIGRVRISFHNVSTEDCSDDPA